MRIAFYTLGCKLNQCESEALASSFGSQGFFVVPPTEEADIYLVNTCTVTSKSEQKARRMIRKFARENPSSLVIVTGCYAQMEPELFESLGPGVRVVAGSRKARLLELPHYLNQTGCAAAFVDEGLATLLGRDAQTAVGDQEASHQEAFNFDAERFSSHSRAFLKIQDGCDNRCTYCRVTLARGDAVSLEASEALRRAQRLEAAGFDEIILTGINLSLYRSGEYDLGGLAGALIDGTSRVRYRLSSIEPDYLTADNIEKLTHERICPHFHLPIQAGDNTVLRRMGRRYRSAQVVEGVRRLREAWRDPFIAADIIVGFPGEDEAAFAATEELLTAIAPAGLHIFPYSARPGTAAADFKPRIPQRIAGERSVRLRELGERLSREYRKRWDRTAEELLIEEPATPAERGHGITGNYLQASFAPLPGRRLHRGRRYPVRLQLTSEGFEASFV